MVNRGDPERVFICVQNGGTVDILNGESVCWLPTSSPTVAGRRVLRANADGDNYRAGISIGTIRHGTQGNGEFGLIQIYGYHPEVKTVGTILSNAQIVTANGGSTLARTTEDASTVIGIVVLNIGAGECGALIQCM